MDQIRLTAEFLAGGTGLGQDIRRIQLAIDLVHPENPMANSVLNVRFHREETDDFGTVGLALRFRPPTHPTNREQEGKFVSPLALVLRENPCKGFQESSSTAEDGHNWLYQFKPVPAHCILLKAPHCHLRHV